MSFKTNAIKTAAKGYRRLTFADGGCIEIEYPVYMMRGIVYTAMPRGECVGTAKFVDHGNRLTCSMDFGKVEGASNPLLQRSDSIQGQICTVDAPLQSTSPPDVAGNQVGPFAILPKCVGKPVWCSSIQLRLVFWGMECLGNLCKWFKVTFGLHPAVVLLLLCSCAWR